MLSRGDISNLIDSFSHIFATKKESEDTKHELKEKMHQVRLDVLDKLDAVFKELKDFRQEQTFHVQSHRDIEDKLDTHEQRLTTLEASPV